MKHKEIAKLFEEIADLLEIKEENPFRIRAYRRAAMNLEGLTEDLEEVAAGGRLRALPGIGADLAQKIQEYLETGKLADLEELRKEVPRGVVGLLAVPGVGPKTAKRLFEELKITDLDGLEAAARDGKIRALPGMQAKSEVNILRGIEFLRRGQGRTPLGVALPLALEVVGRLAALKEVKELCPAGSLRRRKETVGDIDILVVATNPAPVMETFTGLEIVQDVLARGKTKSSIMSREGIQVDVRVVEAGSYGAALAYFTGSKAHNIRLRDMAVRRGLKINEYGVFREKDEKRLGGKQEEEIYGVLDLPFIPPELREDAGEVEAAQKEELPHLIELTDIRGDLHAHSTWSDGHHSIREMAEAANERGYEYLLITDHSKGLGMAGGLTEDELAKQAEEIESVQVELEGLRILRGSEVDIRSDGTMDFPDEILAELDLVVASIHSGFRQPREKMTERIVRAVSNPHVDILAHPTGRLLGEREAYEVDLEAVLRACVEHRTAVEINSYPLRLDLSDIWSRRAHELGVMLVISTDSHATDQLGNVEYGLSVARRGWVESAQVLNTRPWEQIREWLERG